MSSTTFSDEKKISVQVVTLTIEQRQSTYFFEEKKNKTRKTNRFKVTPWNQTINELSFYSKKQTTTTNKNKQQTNPNG